LELMKDEIHVFHSSLDLSPVLRKQLEETLSADEWRRAEHFHFEKDRNRFVTGRGFLRKILGWLLRLPPSSLIFCYGPHGKPQLATPTVGHLLRFNVAHSDSIGVYAVSRGFEVGIDLERIRHIPEAGQIAAKFFSDCEAALWHTLPPDQQIGFFFDCWTRKEAYLKATGQGFSGLLKQNQASCTITQTSKRLMLGGGLPMDPSWFFYPLKSVSGYAGAVVARNQRSRVVNWAWGHGIH
jgi:4'-phosphopantetheinyl transferase